MQENIEILFDKKITIKSIKRILLHIWLFKTYIFIDYNTAKFPYNIKWFKL